MVNPEIQVGFLKVFIVKELHCASTTYELLIYCISALAFYTPPTIFKHSRVAHFKFVILDMLQWMLPKSSSAEEDWQVGNRS